MNLPHVHISTCPTGRLESFWRRKKLRYENAFSWGKGDKKTRFPSPWDTRGRNKEKDQSWKGGKPLVQKWENIPLEKAEKRKNFSLS